MEFIGNSRAITFINKILESGQFGQAYLFSGPESVGKFFLAKAFARSIINESKLVFSDESLPLDLIVVSPEIEEKKGKKREKDIPIEHIREAQKDMALFPHSGKRKVLIIENAHKLTISSQNSLLKILEEPNSTSVIILVSHEDSKILPTIKSRCQRINFSLVSKENMGMMDNSFHNDHFEKYEIMSMGRPGLFHNLIRGDGDLSEYEKAYSYIEKMESLDVNQRLSYAEQISKDTSMAVKTLNIWIWVLRKKCLENGAVNAKNFYATIGRIEKSISNIKNTNANARLVLENLLMEI